MSSPIRFHLAPFIVLAAAVGLLAVAGLPPALGQCELAKLLASDGAANDQFGAAVAIAGDTALIGARFDEDRGPDAGAAYVFQRDGSGWVERQKLLASDGAAEDYFGRAVTIGADPPHWIVIGAINHDDNGSNSGAAYLFSLDGSTWVERQKLLASDGASNDQFGYSVAITGGPPWRIVVGSRGDGPMTGAAYVFHYNGSSWVQQQKLVASDAADGDQFGTSVSISGDVVLVGAYTSDDYGYDSGSAYVFRFDGESWGQEAKLLPTDGAEQDFFGWAVALSGQTALVGAYGDDDKGSLSGSAYVFRFGGESWVQEQKLLASDGTVNRVFGKALALSGDTALIASHRDGDNGLYAGAAYVFRFEDSNWVEQAKLSASDGDTGDRLGWSVGLAPSPPRRAVLGANKDKDNGYDSGSAYVFRVTACPGDLDGDDDVDLSDLATLIGNYGLTGGARCGDGDLEPPGGDGDINLADLAEFLPHYGTTCQ